jgi:hypothetical protein
MPPLAAPPVAVGLVEAPPELLAPPDAVTAPPEPAAGGELSELQPSSERAAKVNAPARTWACQIFIEETPGQCVDMILRVGSKAHRKNDSEK